MLDEKAPPRKTGFSAAQSILRLCVQGTVDGSSRSRALPVFVSRMHSGVSVKRLVRKNNEYFNLTKVPPDQMMNDLRHVNSLGIYVPDTNETNFLRGKLAGLSAAEILMKDDARFNSQPASVPSVAPQNHSMSDHLYYILHRKDFERSTLDF